MNYDGGKNAPGVAQRIISQIPRHRVFVELFGGSAAITRTILPAERNLIVEKDPAVVAEFRDGILQEQPHAEIILGSALRWLALAEEIEPDWCIYCDPPYHPETLRSPQKYACKFSAEDHLALLALLLQMPCPVLISGYRHPLYDVTLRSWRRIGYWVYDRTGRRRSESLWMNFPKPRWLHDARHVGRDRRERENLAKRGRTFRDKLRRADCHELQLMAHDLDEEIWSRGGSDAADPVGGVLRRVNGRRSIELLAPRGSASRDRGKRDRPGGELLLSLFPGIGLLDRAFREEGFCVAAGPDAILGQDVADFVGAAGRFDGIIGGPPCQDFSSLNRAKNGRARHEILSSYGAEMLRHFLRIVAECKPTWFLIENVPGVPDVEIAGYQVQRFGLTDLECGGVQRRNRHFQFGHRAGWIIRPERVTELQDPQPAALASDGQRTDRTFEAHCRLQGLDRPVTLPGWSRTAKFKAVGNGVPVPMGRVLARSVTAASPRDAAADCVCGCGRRITPPARHATASCRKVMERRRSGERPVVRV